MTKKPPTGQYLHYDPERTDYAVTEAELQQLEQGSGSLWKDVCLVCIPLALSCLINGFSEYFSQTTFHVTPNMFFNMMIGFVCLVFGIVFGLAWYQSRSTFKDVTTRIKNKTRYEIPAGLLIKRVEPITDPTQTTQSIIDKDKPEVLEHKPPQITAFKERLLGPQTEEAKSDNADSAKSCEAKEED